jgi:hypothetical protein
MGHLSEDFDYKKTLKDNDASLILGQDTDYFLVWPKGSVWIGSVSLEVAEYMAALFIELCLRGLSVSFAHHLMRSCCR